MAASRAVPLAAGAVAGVGPQGRYRGMTVAGTAAVRVRVWDNASAASGTIVDEVNLGAAGSTWTEYTDVMLLAGLFVEFVAGAPEGSLRVA